MIRCWLVLSILAIATAEGKESSFDVVDTHVHLILHGQLNYDWFKDNRPFLKENTTMERLESAAKTTPVKYFVVVEAVLDAMTEVETLIKISKQHDSLVGIVAGFSLNESLQDKLDMIKPGNMLVGIRDRRHNATQMHTDFRLWPALETLEKNGLTLDIIAGTRDLKSLTHTAKKYPSLKIIINHLGIPFKDAELHKEWMEGITEVAKHPNIYMKVSQFFNIYDFQVVNSETLQANRSLSHYEEIKPKVKHILESFSADRCLFGSDFPNALTGFHSYADIYDIADRLLQDLSTEDRRKIFKENAIRVYGLDIKRAVSDAGWLESCNLIYCILISFWMRYWIH